MGLQVNNMNDMSEKLTEGYISGKQNILLTNTAFMIRCYCKRQCTIYRTLLRPELTHGLQTWIFKNDMRNGALGQVLRPTDKVEGDVWHRYHVICTFH